MTSSNSPRAKALRALKQLMGPLPDAIESTIPDTFYFGILAEGRRTHHHDDRAEVLVAGTLLEQSLQVAIQKKFVLTSPEDIASVFTDDSAPLNSFDAKVRIAFALGLMGPLAKADLTIMRHIRNTFAHSRLKVSYKTPEIVTACEQITLPDRWSLTSDPMDTRNRFILTAFQYFLNFVTFENEPWGTVARKILDLPPE